MKIHDHLLLILAGAAFGLAVVQYVHPLDLRAPPSTLIVVALLLTLRWALRKQRRKKADMLKEVPRNPLGLEDK